MQSYHYFELSISSPKPGKSRTLRSSLTWKGLSRQRLKFERQRSPPHPPPSSRAGSGPHLQRSSAENKNFEEEHRKGGKKHLLLTNIREKHGIDEGGLAKAGLACQHQVERESTLHRSPVHLHSAHAQINAINMAQNTMAYQLQELQNLLWIGELYTKWYLCFVFLTW